jgi:hypothetical protein
VCGCVCVWVLYTPSQRLTRLLKFPPQGIAMTKFALRGKLVRRLAHEAHDMGCDELWQRRTRESLLSLGRTPLRIAELLGKGSARELILPCG